MQPLSIFKEIILVPAVELVPVFGGLAVIFFCTRFFTRKGDSIELTFITIIHGGHLLPVQGFFYCLVVPFWGWDMVPALLISISFHASKGLKNTMRSCSTYLHLAI